MDGSGSTGIASIQAGIDSAAVGDTVTVLAGTYFENIDFLGKDILVRGIGATIDGGMDSSCVFFRSGETRAAVLEGFTLTRGFGRGNFVGGGVHIGIASPTVRDNLITGNTSEARGGGIGMFGRFESPSGPRIEGNVILGNTTGTNGGGIGISAFGACEVVDNRIEDNEAPFDGGGLWMFLTGDPCLVEGNVILGNRSGDHAGGVFVAAGNATIVQEITVRGNLVAHNSARLEGRFPPLGAGAWLVLVTGEVVENTFYGNGGGEADPSSAVGAALALCNNKGIVVERNIFAGHEVGRTAIWCFDGTRTVQDNLAWNTIPTNTLGECLEWDVADGNIEADPYFCDAENGDFTLAANSPALTHPAGPVGAFGQGCDPVSIEPLTWGQLKSKYRSGTP